MTRIEGLLMLCYRLYHGSPRKEEILERGFDVEAPRASNPGDFGWGIYLTSDLARAKASGPVLEVQTCFETPLVLHSPYRIHAPETAGDKFIAELRKKYGDTIHGLTDEEAIELHRKGKSPEEIAEISRQNRIYASRKWAEEIQKAGYDAVVWEKPWLYKPIEENYEVVIFDPNKIKGVKQWK